MGQIKYGRLLIKIWNNAKRKNMYYDSKAYNKFQNLYLDGIIQRFQLLIMMGQLAFKEQSMHKIQN